MLALLLFLLFDESFATREWLDSSCIGLRDGHHWLKLLDDTDDREYPAVYVICDNEYMIIDVNKDSNLIHYFDSYDTYHYALAGSKDKFDGKNWEEWWLPNAHFTSKSKDPDDIYFKYAISPTCDVCDTKANAESIQNYADQTYADTYGDRTGYYMTATLFGCMANHKPLRDCIWDWDTYECSFCSTDETYGDEEYISFTASDMENIWKYQSIYDESGSKTDLFIGLCGVFPQSSYADNVASSQDECFSPDTVKPSIGTDGRFCICVQTTEQQKYEISSENWNKYKLQKEEMERGVKEVKTYTIDDVYELYQTDFEDGTYRITHSGTYKIMEDIEFDFNAPNNYDSPNQGDAWWPKASQSDDYLGAWSTRDAYFMGFFAGITVETDDVVIDLNEFTIKQSKAFYYQQRHFACISLKSVIFSLNQGPGIFGTDTQFASNVVIKNGNIGLSSHFGIHGIWNKNVLIENIHVFDFETHGIEMSYFTDLVINNVDIGPSSTIAYLNAKYAYGRFTEQRMEMVADDYNGKTDYSEYFPITFDNRDESVTFDEITTKLRAQMDMAFKYVMGVETYSDDDDEWMAAKTLFINEDGVPYGAVMYGLFLNLYFANVFFIHPSMKHAKNVEINNLQIHDLRHRATETVRMDKYSVGSYHNPYGAVMDTMTLLGEEQISVGSDNIDWETVSYIGDALTDAHIALKMASSDTGIGGVSYLSSDFLNWAIGNNEWNMHETSQHPYLGCNGDVMNHLLKGVMGIRIDGVEDVQINGLEIANLYEHSDLPSNVCGKYYNAWSSDVRIFKGGGHFGANTPYAYGYTGNRVHGIFADWTTVTMSGDIDIHDLYCDTGLVRGIGMYLSASLVIENDDTSLAFSNMASGIELVDVDTMALPHPYVSAHVQPISMFCSNDNYKYDNDEDGEGKWSGIDYETDEFYGTITAPTDDLNDWISVSCVYADDSILMTDIDGVVYDNDRDCGSDLMDGLFANKKVSLSKHKSKNGVWNYYEFVFVAAIIISFVAFASLCGVCNSKSKYSHINSQFVAHYGSA